jgi:hypothetical protein
VPTLLQRRLSRAALSLLSFALFTLSAPGWSERQLPKDAHYGQMTRFSYPLASINKHTFRMAPGARIYNHQNLTITPAAMPPQAQVLFRVDAAGQLSSIWLLTAQEAARYKKPTTAWTPPTASTQKPPAGSTQKPVGGSTQKPPADSVLNAPAEAAKGQTTANPSGTGRY